MKTSNAGMVNWARAVASALNAGTARRNLAELSLIPLGASDEGKRDGYLGKPQRIFN
jgi:hypothetical protein